jgi:hypothetical protein
MQKLFVFILLFISGIISSQVKSAEFFTIKGDVRDLKSGIAIANADIYLLNSNKSVIANSDGVFQFVIPRSSFNDRMIIAAIGHSSDTISVSELEKNEKNQIFIKLKPQEEADVNLDETTVFSSKRKIKALTAQAILRKAKDQIKDNYYQKPFNQKIFFRAQTSKDKVFTINEEALINTYSPNGIKVSEDAAENFFGEILQFRTKDVLESEENWKGIGYLGVVIFRNIMLSNQNVLYETKPYELKKEGITMYNGKKVYVISFTNLEPDLFSTGFGNPAPSSATGFIYIEKDSFAVVKFEQYIILKPERSNDNDDIKIDSTLKITQTYKNIGGKYFINYCNEKVESNYFSIGDKTLMYTINSNYDLMSEDINLENVSIIKTNSKSGVLE